MTPSTQAVRTHVAMCRSSPLAAFYYPACSHACWLWPGRHAIEQHFAQRPDAIGLSACRSEVQAVPHLKRERSVLDTPASRCGARGYCNAGRARPRGDREYYMFNRWPSRDARACVRGEGPCATRNGLIMHESGPRSLPAPWLTSLRAGARTAPGAACRPARPDGVVAVLMHAGLCRRSAT